MTMAEGVPPSTPLLRRGLAVVQVRDGLLVDGTVRRHLFTGAAATELLPRLLPLLDGSRDIEGLSAAVDLPAEQVEYALKLLKGRGLLEETELGQRRDVLESEAAVYFSRTFGTATQLAGMLAQAVVLISAPKVFAAVIAGDLREAGVGNVLVRNWEDGPDLSWPGSPRPPQRSLAVVLDTPDSPVALADHLAALRWESTPVLRCSGCATSAEIGPLFYGDYSACPLCFQRGYRAARWVVRQDGAAGDGSDHATGIVNAQTVEDVLAGMVVAEVLALLAGTSRPASQRALKRLLIPDCVTCDYLVSPYADCLRCGWQEGKEEGSADATGYEQEVIDYEWQMAALQEIPAFSAGMVVTGIWSYNGSEIPRAQQHLNGQKYDSPKYLAYLPHRALPAAEQVQNMARISPEAFLSRVLGRLCGRESAGSSAQASDRSSAASYGLEAVEFYIMAPYGLLGLPGSILRYDDANDQIFAVRADDITLEECLRWCDLNAEHTTMALVCVGPRWSMMRSKGNWAYRFAHLEAGQIAMRLSLIAHAHGVEACFSSAWQRDMAQLLELRQDREMILMITGLTMSEW
jgi:hypothetical protein